MRAHGRVADDEALRDLRVRRALRDERQHVALARRDVTERSVVDRIAVEELAQDGTLITAWPAATTRTAPASASTEGGTRT